MRREQKSCQEIYTEKWKHIVENEDGSLNRNQVMRELSDYSFLLSQIPSVYEEVSGHSISKPMTYGFEVIRKFRENFISFDLALDDLTAMCEDGKVSLEDIKEYFSKR
ncbi:hypothetical protein [Priestia megaterium]|uniref:hypothetical protein n=1 Tax=Priestia megaterium TaxID=1404 RepID=UPI000BF55744|nr:hypothetical protein [Priestia megaterium]PFR93501.1 hypothetical protein COK39_17575 [Priestia megaterium]